MIQVVIRSADGNDDNYCLPSRNCGNTAIAITNLEIVGKYKYQVGKVKIPRYITPEKSNITSRKKEVMSTKTETTYQTTRITRTYNKPFDKVL